MDQPIRTPKSVYLTLGAGFVLGAVCMAGVATGRSPLVTPAQAVPQITLGKPMLASGGMDGIPELRNLDNSFRTLARVVGPAVVDIKAGRGSSDGRVMVSEGEGSGFLVSNDGWIVTNDHVVDGAKTVTVTLKDGRTFEGKVTPSNDETSDIAIVKIEAKALPYLAFADSATVEPGEFAMAVGAPFGLANSVTIGHVSALGRDTDIGGGGKMRGYSDLIQTDAAINMGNSGGPLVNVDGQVIGMNTAIYSPTGGSNGIGFAIPSNQVRLISNLLMKGGKLTRSMMGVKPETVKEFERTGLLKDGGARITALGDKNPPAAEAGLKAGDVIVKIGDRAVRSEMDLRNAMLTYTAGTTVDVQYVRDNVLKTVKVKLQAYEAQGGAPAGEERPRRRRGDNGGSEMSPFERFRQFNIPGFGDDDESAPSENSEIRKVGEPAKLGVEIADADETVRTRYGLPKESTGAVVVTVAAGSIADNLGLKPGDVVESIDGKAVTSGKDLQDAMKGVKWGDHKRVRTVRYNDGTRLETTRDVLFK